MRWVHNTKDILQIKMFVFSDLGMDRVQYNTCSEFMFVCRVAMYLHHGCIEVNSDCIFVCICINTRNRMGVNRSSCRAPILDS
jgi:hypothetical protein